MIRSPYPPKRLPPQADMALGSAYLANLLKDLEEIKKENVSAHEAQAQDHKQMLEAHGAHIADLGASHARMQEEHGQKMAEIDTALSYIRSLEPEKGDKGDPGDKPVAGFDYLIPRDGESVSHEKVVADVLSQIRQPEDGKTPIIDKVEIAKEVAKLIKIPKAKEIKIPSIEDITTSVVEWMKENLTMEHVPAIKNEIASYRNQLAGKVYGRDTMVRGGGDTVAAGTGVTINTANGVKTISVGAAGLSVLTATGTVDDSNTIFTFASTPTLVVVNGVSYRNGHGVTIAGTTATLDNPVGTNNGDIYALG